MASVFGMALVVKVNGNLEQQNLVVTSPVYICPSQTSTLVSHFQSNGFFPDPIHSFRNHSSICGLCFEHTTLGKNAL